VARTRTAGRRLSATARRQQLLDVARRLFADLGFHGVSMDHLAETAGVSKPVLYQHFPSKRDLYVALVNDATDELESRMRLALEGTTDNRARVACAISAYFDFVGDRRFRLLLGTTELGDDTVRQMVDAAMEGVAGAIGALIAEDAGLDRRSADFLANAVRGLATEGARWWMEQPGMDKDEAVRLLSRLAWRGLGSFAPPGAASA
jgi:AcrR family transcriptional regulator